MSENSTYQKLRGHLAYLRLAAAAEALPGALDHAAKEKLGHTAFLERLLKIEVAATEARRHAGLERFANLPAPWRLADFDFDAQPSVDRKLVDELGTLRFLEDATNVLFIGPPGVGKTMLAVGLGRASVDAGYRTYYTTAADLAARCHRAALEGRWATTMRFFAGPRLLIIDLCRRGTYADRAVGSVSASRSGGPRGSVPCDAVGIVPFHATVLSVRSVVLRGDWRQCNVGNEKEAGLDGSAYRGVRGETHRVGV